MNKYLTLLLILSVSSLLAGWDPLEPVPDEVAAGGGITYGGGYVWCVIGGDNSDFYAYDIATGEWIENLDDVPAEICDAGAITYETGYGRRIFVATFNQLFVYTKKYSWGSAEEGEWNEDNPIYLPSECGPGVSLAFQPNGTGEPYWYPITGWLYLLLGGGSRAFYRRGFEVLVEYPEGFYPPNDSQISQSNLIFDWSPGDENVTYQFQLDRTNSFASPIIDTLISVSEFRPPEGLLGNGTYYWRVRFNRNRRQFEWSQPKRFRLANSGRPRVNYRYPTNRAILVTAHPILDWAPIGRTNRYRIQIGDDSLFSMPVVDAETEMSECRTELANGEYWWRTSYILENGEWSSWSEANSFEIQEGWQPLDNIPVAVNAGGAMCYHTLDGQESLYAFVGGGNTLFYCYSIRSNTWTPRHASPLNQNDGSSIVSAFQGSIFDCYELYAIFGVSEEREEHWKYEVDDNEWDDVARLPRAILGSGASLAYDPMYDNAYLVIGGERDNFYIYSNPGLEEAEEGPQSQEAIPISQKSRISSYQDRLIIHYSTDAPSRVRIQIYDLSGKRVKTLFIDNVKKGEHQAVWNKTDTSNRKVSSGVYFITINKENRTERLKVTIR